MRAVVYREYGSPDVLNLEEVEKPSPRDGEVLVQVHAASINSWDWDLLTGTFLTRLLGAPLRPKYRILGADIAGRIEAVGGNVTSFRPGDEVFGDISGSGWGGFAQYVCARESVLAPKSPNLSFEEAASIPQAGVLALQGLRYRGPIRPGQKVLINGAGGGVGTFAVQIAVSSGAEVTGVDKAEKLDMLRSLGADQLIDYTQEDFTKSGQRYDLILDVAAYHSIFDYRRALSPSGTYVTVGGSTPRILQIALLGPLLSRTGDKTLGILMHRPNRDDLIALNDLIESGKVIPVIDRRYPLAEVPEALRYFGEGQVQGKVVIVVPG